MEWMIACILITYFAIGAIAIALINRKKDRAAAKEGWIKYFAYLVIVLIMLISMRWKIIFLAVSSLIILISAYEMIDIWRKSKQHNISVLVCGLLVFCLCAFCTLLLISEGKLKFLMILYTIVFSFDGFSQISGQLFGKRKLVSKISPAKTIEGSIGGFASAILTGLLLFPFIAKGSERPLTEPALLFILFSILIALSAFSGDLIASVYKRKVQVKDYSNIIPGHGGMLDRFDSFIGACAVVGILWLTGILKLISAPLIL